MYTLHFLLFKIIYYTLNHYRLLHNILNGQEYNGILYIGILHKVALQYIIYIFYPILNEDHFFKNLGW